MRPRQSTRTEPRACLLHEKGALLSESGEPRKALPVLKRALVLFETEDGPGSPDVANVLLEMGRAEHDLARFPSALVHATRASGILASVRAPDLDLVRLRVQARQAMGEALVALGDFRAARRHVAHAVKLANARLPPGELAAPLNQLGIIAKYTARFEEAARLYRRALAIVRRQRDNALALASLYHNVAGLEHARGRFHRAIAPARRGLALRRRALGSDHVDVAADAAALAAILDGAGQRREAERLYRFALGVFQSRLGPRHFEVAFNLGNLAALYQDEGRHAEAARLYMRAIRLKRAALGARHPDLALTLANFAVLREAQGRRDEALSLYAEAIAMARSTLGGRHPEVRRYLEAHAALRRAPPRGPAARKPPARRRSRT